MPLRSEVLMHPMPMEDFYLQEIPVMRVDVDVCISDYLCAKVIKTSLKPKV
jgi:hypothetical protein